MPLSSVALLHVMPYHEQIGSSDDQWVSTDAPENKYSLYQQWEEDLSRILVQNIQDQLTCKDEIVKLR
jgi:hypothetical protein